MTRLSVTQLARMMGMKHETATAILREAGLEPEARDGRTLYYRTRDALAAIFDSDSFRLTSERAKLAKEQADAQRIKNEELRGSLIPRGDVEAGQVALASSLVLRLDAIPSKAAPVVRATETDAEGEAVLRRYIDEARVELADLGRDVLEGRLELRLVAPGADRSDGDGARGAPAAAAPHGERVGRPRAKAKPRKRGRARTVEHGAG